MSDTIAIVGAGTIGASLGILFASAGYTVKVWDPDPRQFVGCRADMAERMRLLSAYELLDEDVDAVLTRVSFHEDLESASSGAALVQECAPEDAALKRDLFDRLGHLTSKDTPLAGSSSAITPSQYARGTSGQHRVLGAHPANPPYLLSLMEIIPSAFTNPAIVTRAEEIYRTVGLTTVVVPVEIEGFIMNRLQGAVLREAYCLVRDGVATVESIDAVMRTSLGPRWSFMGPFETVDLNTRGGIAAHAERMGPAYERMGAERGMHDPWTADLVAKVVQQRREILPMEDWPSHVRWRDEQLMSFNRRRNQDLVLRK